MRCSTMRMQSPSRKSPRDRRAAGRAAAGGVPGRSALVCPGGRRGRSAGVAPPAAPTSDYRRPFIDPAIVGRLASFKATACAAHLRRSIAAAPPQPEDRPRRSARRDGERGPSGRRSPLQRLSSITATRRRRQPHRHEVAYADDAAPADARAMTATRKRAAADYDPAPDVETIDVPEMAVAVADDLDIPELAYEQDEPAAAGL